MKRLETTDEIELLKPDLLSDKKSFNEVYFWIKMFVSEVGWHYPLDLIWQYKKILDLDLPKGSTILDAGAGSGMMQFILAGQGYNILSVDFSDRKIPLLQSKIFKMKNDNHKIIKNDYTKHLSANYKFSFAKIFHKLKLSFKNLSIFYIIKGLINKKKYGSIQYIRSDFSDLSFLQSNSIDAVVSTSAIEHNPEHENLKKAIVEFNRVLKPKSAMFITTSAINKKCFFDKPTKGYLYDENTLLDIFQLSKHKSNFSKYSEIFDQIFTCNFLKENIAFGYKNNPNCGLPFGIWNPRYLPVGVIKWKK